MAKNRNMHVGRLLIFLLAAQLLGASCATLRQPAQKADSDFYRDYSKKMGVRFDGVEDKSLIKASAGWLGVPYRYGGQNRSGTDCSALVGSVYREAYGINLPRSTSEIAKQTKRIKKSELACGDLIFFTIKEKRASHVGIYLANGKFVHAASSKGVSVADLNDAYWSKYFSAAGRVRGLPPAGKSSQAVRQQIAVAEKQKPAAAKPTKPKSKSKPDKNTSNAENSSGDIIIVFDEEF
ncbi:MAG: C40 family peptidase [Prevotellaceae bacterium]|nr:C40 family peptidase [Prevotellaceae bacterium]